MFVCVCVSFLVSLSFWFLLALHLLLAHYQPALIQNQLARYAVASLHPSKLHIWRTSLKLELQLPIRCETPPVLLSPLTLLSSVSPPSTPPPQVPTSTTELSSMLLPPQRRPPSSSSFSTNQGSEQRRGRALSAASYLSDAMEGETLTHACKH